MSKMWRTIFKLIFCYFAWIVSCIFVTQDIIHVVSALKYSSIMLYVLKYDFEIQIPIRYIFITSFGEKHYFSF